MGYMFYNTKFNQDMSGWDTSSADELYNMFSYARSFNQNLCDWDLTSVQNVNLIQSMFSPASGCQVQTDPTPWGGHHAPPARCQPCEVPVGRRLGSSNNNNNSINRNSNNKHRNDRNLQGIVGDNDDTSVVAPFHMITTVNKADDGPVALQQTAGGSITTGTSTLQALRNLQPSTGLEGLFEMNIEIDIPSNESSASLPSSMTTTVAVIGIGSILSVVSSMI